LLRIMPGQAITFTTYEFVMNNVMKVAWKKEKQKRKYDWYEDH
jgi:hypothetical protein